MTNTVTDVDEYRVFSQKTETHKYIFMNSGITSYYFAEECTIAPYAFKDSKLTDFAMTPSYIRNNAFEGTTDVKNAYFYPHESSRFGAEAFKGWGADQSIYFMNVTRAEFDTILSGNTSNFYVDNYADVFAGCNAKVYFLEDIVKMDTVSFDGVPTTFDNGIMDDLAATTINVYSVNAKNKLKAAFFSNLKETQTVYFKNYGFAELFEHIEANALAGTNAKLYDKDGNQIVVEGNDLLFKNAAGETVAIYTAAKTADALTALNLTSAATLGYVHFSGMLFSDLATLQKDVDSFAALAGLGTTITDKDGNVIKVDANGIISELHVDAHYVEKASSSGGGGAIIKPLTLKPILISGATGESTIKDYSFANLKSTATVYIEGDHNYADLMKLGDTKLFAGCAAKIYDCDGNLITVNADGNITKITSSTGNVIYEADGTEDDGGSTGGGGAIKPGTGGLIIRP